jgi:acyl-CoA thioester hydrolase
MEAASGDYPGVGEPEVEQVAIDQKAVAQRGHRIEELEQCLLDPRRRHSEVGIGHDHKGAAEHGAKDGLLLGLVQPEMRRQCERLPSERLTREAAMATVSPAISETVVRVNYSETDQMGVVYHARYLVWLDVARCDYLRHSGTSYRDLEQAGLRLAVSEVSIRFRQPAHYDDLVRVRCWVRDVASRRVEFGYAVELAGDARLLATASTSLLALDQAMSLTRLPDHVRRALQPIPDPIKLG